MKRRMLKTKRRRLTQPVLPVIPEKNMGGFKAGIVPLYCTHRWIFNYGKWWIDNTSCYHCEHSKHKECPIRGGDDTELLKRFGAKRAKKTNSKRRRL